MSLALRQTRGGKEEKKRLRRGGEGSKKNKDDKVTAERERNENKGGEYLCESH